MLKSNKKLLPLFLQGSKNFDTLSLSLLSMYMYLSKHRWDFPSLCHSVCWCVCLCCWFGSVCLSTYFLCSFFRSLGTISECQSYQYLHQLLLHWNKEKESLHNCTCSTGWAIWQLATRAIHSPSPKQFFIAQFLLLLFANHVF